jgi:uncharacterized membrane protein
MNGSVSHGKLRLVIHASHHGATPNKEPTVTELIFPKPYEHKHPPVANLNDVIDQQLSFGQRTADRVAALLGSWPFIIVQSVLLVAWAIVNVVAWSYHWDPYPFILMNLFLSLQAAYTAPVILMSQNREVQRDRLEAHNDYELNQKAEEEIRVILAHLSAQDQALEAIHQQVLALTRNS